MLSVLPTVKKKKKNSPEGCVEYFLILLKNLSSHGSGGQEFEIQVLAELIVSGDSESRSVPSLSPQTCWLLASFGVLRLVNVSLQSLPPSSHGVLPVYLCHSVQISAC